ncbi:MAG: ThuA domain-containing protein [Bryobacterales bacterium]|nr:ThuA domain-containing protein [Bryobacterales bacterium]
MRIALLAPLLGLALLAQEHAEFTVRVREVKAGKEVVRNAERMAGAFENMIAYWRQRNADAAKWSEQGKAAAVRLASAAHAGDSVKAGRAVEDLEATCRSCHAKLAAPRRQWPLITEIRGPERLTPEARRKVEEALPTKAFARPARPRKLLVMDLQVNYPGHPSIPHANLAVDLMGQKLGAWQATFSNDMANLRWDRLRQFDALYLNNTVGPLFTDPEVRESLLRFIREGGGLIGNHGSTHCSMDWPEFTEMIGARNGPHRDADEKVVVKLDDPRSPLTAMFHGRGFVFADEFFRFPGPPYSREKLRILMSIDVAKTDMNQGRDCKACVREDNDYAISWIRSYGKGRVFYCSLGHNPEMFSTPVLLQHFLAGIQFALGDLEADTTPSGRLGDAKP